MTRLSDAFSTTKLLEAIEGFEHTRAEMVRNHVPPRQIDKVSERIRLYRGILAERGAQGRERGEKT